MRDRISREEGTLRWRTLTGEPRRSQVQVPKKTLKSKSLTKELWCSRAQIPRNNGIIKVFFLRYRGKEKAATIWSASSLRQENRSALLCDKLALSTNVP